MSNLTKEQDAIFNMGRNVGSCDLAEKMRVMLDALHESIDKDGPDSYILIGLMRDVLKPHLPVE